MMSKQKRVTATVKMTYTWDEDLIVWWQSLPLGSRNAVMKDMMREYIVHQQGGYRRPPALGEAQRLSQIEADTAWLRRAVGDLSAYLELLTRQLATSTLTSAGAGLDNRVLASEDDAAQREEHMRKLKW